MAESKERWQQQACSANERVPSPTQHAHSVSCSDRSVLHFKAETSVQADGMSDLLAGVSQFPVSETTVTNDLEDQSLPQYWPDMEINHDGMYHVTDEGDGSGAWLPSPQGLADEPTHSDVSTITMVPEPKVEVKPQQPCFEAPTILTTEKILYEIQNDEKIASLLGKYPKYNRVLVYYYLYKGMRTQEKDNPLIAEAAEKAAVTYQHAYNFIGNFRRSIGASRHRGQRIWTPWTKNSPGKAAASPAGLPSSLPGVLQPEENHDGLGLSMEENHTGLLERMEGESPPSGGEASVVDPCMTRMDGMNSGTNFLNELKQDPEIAKQLERFPKYNGVLVYYYLYKGMRTQEKDNSLIAEASEKAGVTYQHAYYFIGNFRRATGESRTRTRRDAGPWDPPHFPYPGPLQQHLTQYGQSGSPSLESASTDGHDADGSSELTEATLGTSTGYRDGCEERGEGDGLVGPPSDGAMWGACTTSPFRGCGQEMELVTETDRILEKLKANKDIARRLERFPKYNRVLAYYYLYKGMRTQEKDNPLIAEAAEKAGVTYQHAYNFIGNFRRATGGSKVRGARLGMTCVSGVTGSVDKGVEQLHGCRKRRKGGTMLGWSPQASPAQALGTVGYPGGDRTGDDSADSFGIIRQNLQRIQQLMEDNQRYGCEGLAMAFCFQPSTAHTQEPLLWVLGSPEGKSLLAEHRIGDYVALLWRAKRIRDVEIKKMESNADNSKALDELGQWDEAEKDSTALPQSTDCGHEVPNASTSEPGPSPPNQPLRTNRRLPSTSSGGGWNARPHCHMEQGHGHQ